MKLVRLARKRWEVLAICDSRDDCPVTEFLDDLKGTSYQVAAEQMGRLLVVQVPANGPPRTEPICKPLGDGLFEFRKQPKGKNSVLSGSMAAVPWWFVPLPSRRLNVHPEPKSSGRALIKKRYLEARRDGTLEISDT